MLHRSLSPPRTIVNPVGEPLPTPRIRPPRPACRGRSSAARATSAPVAFEVTSKCRRAIDRVERCAVVLECLRLPADLYGQLRHDARIRETHHTTHIEGSRLSLAEARLLLPGGAAPGAMHMHDVDPEDVRELRNAMATLSGAGAAVWRHYPITEMLVRSVHRGLVDEVRGGRARPGAYRQLQNQVGNAATGEVIYVPPPAFEVPRLMSEMVSWVRTQNEYHPLVVAAIAHFRLVDIHPFVDGNGRAARVLPYLILHSSLPIDLLTLSEHYDLNRPAYYQAIQSVRETAPVDATSWLEYFLAGLSSQLDDDLLPTAIDQMPHHRA